MSDPFRLLLRVRYNECDAQGIVFNARWGDYIDIAASEYTRALFGTVNPDVSGVGWRVVKQTTEWRAPATFDDVLDLRVRTGRIGTTSFVLHTEISRLSEATPLVTSETIYVMVDHRAGTKQPIRDAVRAAFERGASGVVVDHAAALTASAATSPVEVVP